MMMMLKMMRFLVSFLLGVIVSDYGVSATGGVFSVLHKFAGQPRSLSAMKEHDLKRHGRSLFSVDFPLAGDGKPTGTGLYYTKIKIGSPSIDYYVHVDTGSDLFWVNCIQCSGCPKKSNLGLDLKLYDPSKSGASRIINCDNAFCSSNADGPIDGCVPGLQCQYKLSYGDGSTTAGYFVEDVIQFDRVSGNSQTTADNSSVIFGCGVQQTGNLRESGIALDGLVGFGQSDTSMMSQIAASTSMKKIFAHCLNGKNGGGIFAMGNVVEPKVKTTPLLPNQTHYNVNLDSILIGNNTLQLPKGVLGAGTERETIIDSGTTLAYVPDEIYTPLINKIMENHSNLGVHTVQESFSCFAYNSSLDTDFPTVTLNFEGSLQFVVYPHDYLFELNTGEYCIGWQSSSTQSKDIAKMILLGDLVLSNKLVLYNVENMTIGWTEYDCSKSIEVQDEESKAVYDVAPEILSSAHSHHMGLLTIVFLLCALLHTLTYSGH